MALPPDDWVSTSPIAAPAPARIAKAVTPGRALTREEIRQQRRRGNPALTSNNNTKTKQRAQPIEAAKSAQEQQPLAGTSNTSIPIDSDIEKPHRAAQNEAAISSPDRFVSKVQGQDLDQQTSSKAASSGRDASHIASRASGSNRSHQSLPNNDTSPVRVVNDRKDDAAARTNGSRHESVQRAPFDSPSPDQSDATSSEGEGETGGQQAPDLPLFRPASSPQPSSPRAPLLAREDKAVSRNVDGRENFAASAAEEAGDDRPVAPKITKNVAGKPAKKIKGRGIPEAQDDQSQKKEVRQSHSGPKANGSKRRREEDVTEELEPEEIPAKPKRSKATSNRMPGDLISQSAHHIKSVLQRMRSRHKDNAGVRTALSRINTEVEGRATALGKMVKQRNGMEVEAAHLRARQTELEAEVLELDSQRAQVAQNLQHEEMMWRQSRRHLKIILALHEKSILLEDDTAEPEDVHNTLESKLLSIVNIIR